MSFTGLKHAFSYWLGGKTPVPKEKELVGHITGLYVYPIKAGRGTFIDEAECTYVIEKENVGDRHWFIATKDGEVLTQKNYPSLVLVESSVHGNELHVNAPGMDTLKISKDPPEKTKPASKYSWLTLQFEGVDCGDAAGVWFSRYLGRDGVRLFYSLPKIAKKERWLNMTPEQKLARPLSSDARDIPLDVLLVISENSVAALNEKLQKQVLVNNFRPNITVKTINPAYDEDDWEEVFIGDAKFTNVQPCTRCLITTVDTKTGMKDPKSEPYKTLRKVRMKPGFGSPCFGIYLLSNTGGKIKVGDPIYATRKSG